MSGLAINPRGVQFEPDTDIPDLDGKTIVVTGGMLILPTSQTTSDITRNWGYWQGYNTQPC
jgi:hypothetical protein